jgi:hypothetical protein
MKAKNKEKLRTDLQKYSKQIGILPNEVLKLVLDRKEMRSLVTGRIRDSKRLAGHGECFYPIRTIFVDASYRLTNDENENGHLCYHAVYDKKTGSWKWVPAKRKTVYRDFLHTLVHELLHYRFAYLRHGKKYEQRITEILRGRTFEPKHVHLFSHIPKSY